MPDIMQYMSGAQPLSSFVPQGRPAGSMFRAPACASRTSTSCAPLSSAARAAAATSLVICGPRNLWCAVSSASSQLLAPLVPSISLLI